MSVRSLVVGALSLAVCLAVSAASNDASAEMRKKGGAGICVTKPAPDCNFFIKAVCTKKSKCGGCLAWKCQGYVPPKK